MRRWLAASLLVFALAAAPGLCDAAVTTSAEAVYWRPTGFDLPVTIFGLRTGLDGFSVSGSRKRRSTRRR